MTALVAERAEDELVEAARRGDEQAFEELYSRYRDRVLSFVVGRVRDRGRAEDVTQEVFFSALRRLRASDRPVAFRPWVFAIATNACIDEYRRATRSREVLVDDRAELPIDGRALLVAPPTPPAAVEAKQRLHDLRGAFGGLSESHHRLLVMRELEGLSYDEIGERMGMTRQMVESSLFRARRKLGEEYEDLTSGRRCAHVQGLIDSGSARSLSALGIRERRRLARHLAHCLPCRHVARMAGVDEALLAPRSTPGRIAALLPFPLSRWVARLGDAGQRAPGSPGPAGHATGRAHLTVVGSMQTAAPVAEQAAGSGYAPMAAAAAAIALAAAGGGVMSAISAGHHRADRVTAAPAMGRATGPARRPVGVRIGGAAGGGSDAHAGAGARGRATPASFSGSASSGTDGLRSRPSGSGGGPGAPAAATGPAGSAGSAGTSTGGGKAAGGGSPARSGSSPTAAPASAGGGSAGTLASAGASRGTGSGAARRGTGAGVTRSGVAGGATSAVGGLAAAAGSTVAAAGSTVSSVTGATGSAVSTLAGTAGSTASTVLGAAGSTVAGTTGAIGSTVTRVTGGVGSTTSALTGALGSAATAVAGPAGSPVSTAAGAAGAALSGVTTAAGAAASNAATDAGATLAGVTRAAGTATAGAAGMAGSVAATAGTTAATTAARVAAAAGSVVSTVLR
jgi:RNA polymerase sigma factor (sigma-70 family)